MKVMLLKFHMFDPLNLSIIIQGPRQHNNIKYIQHLSSSCKKLILVSCSSGVINPLIEDNSEYCHLIVPDPGSFNPPTSKPINFARWYKQVKSAINLVETDYVIIHRSDIMLNLSSISKMYSYCVSSLWCVADTTLSPVITRTPFHYCDWLSGGPICKYKNALPLDQDVTFQTFFSSPFVYKEWGFNFSSIRKSEQLMFAGLLSRDELTKTSIYGGDAGLHLLSKTYTSSVRIKSSASLIATFKGCRFKERPLLIRRMPDDVFPLLWCFKALFFSCLSWRHVVSVLLNSLRFYFYRLKQDIRTF